MKKKRISTLTIVLICFTLFFLWATVSNYNIGKRTLEKIDIHLENQPDRIILAEDGSYIKNPEAEAWRREHASYSELFEDIDNLFLQNGSILFVFIFLTILSFKMSLLEKNK